MNLSKNKGNEKKTNSPKSSAEFVVVHVGLRLPLAPLPGDLIGVGQLELAVGAFPRDDVGVGRVGQKLQQELPKLDLSGSLRNEATAGRGEQGVGVGHWKMILNVMSFLHFYSA